MQIETNTKITILYFLLQKHHMRLEHEENTFLHGFFATGSCPMAKALKEAFEGIALELTYNLL